MTTDSGCGRLPDLGCYYALRQIPQKALIGALPSSGSCVLSLTSTCSLASALAPAVVLSHATVCLTAVCSVLSLRPAVPEDPTGVKRLLKGPYPGGQSGVQRVCACMLGRRLQVSQGDVAFQ